MSSLLLELHPYTFGTTRDTVHGQKLLLTQNAQENCYGWCPQCDASLSDDCLAEDKI